MNTVNLPIPQHSASPSEGGCQMSSSSTEGMKMKESERDVDVPPHQMTQPDILKHVHLWLPPNVCS